MSHLLKKIKGFLSVDRLLLETAISSKFINWTLEIGLKERVK
jgi:hypothetical protein